MGYKWTTAREGQTVRVLDSKYIPERYRGMIGEVIHSEDTHIIVTVKNSNTIFRLAHGTYDICKGADRNGLQN